MFKNQKNIWITGASSGIGKALAIKFANEGWHVAVSARRKELLDDLSKTNPNISSFPLDVTKHESCVHIFENILKKYSSINLCVFSTGIYDPKTEKNINLEQIENVMKVNFFGTLNCIKTVEDYLKNKKEGHIAIMASVAGYRGLPNSSGYGPSKAALINLSESLYFDFKRHKVRISLISPGFIKTPLTDKNKFKMPFLKSPEFAADKIYNGLIKSNSFEIAFPKELIIIMKIFKVLPNRIYLYLIKKLTKFQKN
jgi:short-subunit dehydrogenase